VDTGLSTHPGLEGFRADVPQRAVTPLMLVVGWVLPREPMPLMISQLPTLLMRRLEVHEKTAWMLRSLLGE